ncbi:carbohydrate ABC transporter permease [Ethanoligenens harbinense]|uniref:Binding-protein-dependent transport systems inner membrane component n=1 Tax=Ethanoligenens harbinense (strain DSM 18485 / JCM 12961 / CGMCC 1.5033 / YUAN-3) TaxID=663278 RepID=E6U584_ETHHY|nr:carbohydrate ABC transporter permease [Ethanoligenens harbinense]ADU27897.1 binding-protein-dependent transport systems inner membrane component [Ethanoligenens harbinense YUAN-3]AVQ96926.1 carbohydrate ABC transporter permease [Ethanoligenens harbinense YUAN-3]AYF39587.1 carbohydrate ABC transporter permease [Ethanoligenens harbinense]AYF42413.1 carbohydrate ABC transporter permease [Ethanoligenens harbinense]QCN93166.1 carbohydrate ABC transporter permease [Ethanoligenens harbinense]
MVKQALSKACIYFLLILGAILMLLPFVWMLSTSFKSPGDVMVMPPQWFPNPFQWWNYVTAWQSAPFPRYLLNSVIVTGLGTVGELVTTILAAYAFSNLKFYGRDILFALLLGTMMVPGEVLMIPNFVTIANLGWVDTYPGLIVPWCASIFSIFLLRQFFLAVPKELGYAARVDGCRNFRYLTAILLPMVKPALITILLLKVIGSWNDFLWPLIATNSDTMRTLPVGLTAFSTETGIHYELLMAASTMIILPMVVLFLILQKYVINGVARVGIKG